VRLSFPVITPFAADYIANLSNCPILGEKSSIVNNRRILNLLQLTIDGFPIEIVQPFEIIDQFDDLRGRQTVGTIIRLPAVSIGDVERLNTTTQELAELLGFITGSFVKRYWWSHGKAGNGSPIVGAVWASHPILERSNGSAIRRFLETTWPHYHAIRDSRKLNEVFDAVSSIQIAHLPIEVEAAITFITLEQLKATFGHSTNIPHEKRGFVKKRYTKIVCSRPKAVIEFYSLKELLEEMFNAASVPNVDLTQLVSVRNAIIHEGKSNLSVKDLVEQLYIYQDYIREYLLRIIGFKGDFMLFSSPRIWKTI